MRIRLHAHNVAEIVVDIGNVDNLMLGAGELSVRIGCKLTFEGMVEGRKGGSEEK